MSSSWILVAVRAAPLEPSQKEGGAALRDPAPWEQFTEAVRSGQEGAIRRSFEELYASTKNEMVRFATWCVGQHNSKIIPRHVLDAEEIVQGAFTGLYLKRHKLT